MTEDIQKLKERLENPSDLAGAVRAYLDQLMEDELANALRKEMGVVLEAKGEDDENDEDEDVDVDVDDEPKEDKKKGKEKKSSEDEDDDEDENEEDE